MNTRVWAEDNVVPFAVVFVPDVSLSSADSEDSDVRD